MKTRERDHIMEFVKAREAQLKDLESAEPEGIVPGVSLKDSRISRRSNLASGQRSRVHPLQSRIKVPNYGSSSNRKKREKQREKSTSESLIQRHSQHSIFF